MVKEPQSFKGILNYLNGNIREIEVDGAIDERGAIFVPENLMISNKLFLLNKKMGKGPNPKFEYIEIESGPLPIMWLH